MNSKSRILSGGVVVVDGEAKTLGVIFGNLTGKNFSDPESAVRRVFETHADYLAEARTILGVALRAGDALELVGADGAAIDTGVVGGAFPG